MLRFSHSLEVRVSIGGMSAASSIRARHAWQVLRSTAAVRIHATVPSPQASRTVAHVFLGQIAHDVLIALNEWLQYLNMARDLLPAAFYASELLDVVGNQLVPAALLALVFELAAAHWRPCHESWGGKC